MRRTLTVSIALLSWTFPAMGQATIRVGDVCKLKGQQINRLVGVGLVTGLNGTGDGDKYAPAMKHLRALYQSLGTPIEDPEELKNSKNVAVVFVQVTLPENGVREGDRVDAHVASMGGAKSLAGGRLISLPLLPEDKGVSEVFATAGGLVHTPDAKVPTSGVIRGGAVMTRDVLLAYVLRGSELPPEAQSAWVKPNDLYCTLVLSDAHAGWALANAVTETINHHWELPAGEKEVAMPLDSRNIVVHIPRLRDGASPVPNERPVYWISEIQNTQVSMPETAARVTINRTTGTMSISGDVRLSPVIITQNGLVLNVLKPPPEEDSIAPRLEQESFVKLDPQNMGGAVLGQLLESLNQLKVPIQDRMAIVEQLARQGKLHAEIVYED